MASNTDSHVTVRHMFNSLIDAYYAGKSGRIKPWTHSYVARVIKCIHGGNLAYDIGQKRNPDESYFSKMYDVLLVDGVERVVVKKTREVDGSVKVMLPREEYFDTLQSYHEKLGHVGFEKLSSAVRQRFVLSLHIINTFISCCNICSDLKTIDADKPRKGRKSNARKMLTKINSVTSCHEESTTPVINNLTDPDINPEASIANLNNERSEPYFQDVPQAPPGIQKQSGSPQQTPPTQLPQPPKISPQVSVPKPIAPKPTSVPISQSLPPLPPPPPPEVCLRWNSYHSNMQATFPSLLNNEQFVDVTLACEGRSIKCHKMMLSACSAYFEELLSQNPCQHPIVLMKDLKYWEVQALVDFMYRGEVNVSQDKLPSLLAAAEALQIKGLAGPAFTSHEEDNIQTSTPQPPLASNDDYLDESIPSPTGVRRARKRRAASSAQSSAQSLRTQSLHSPQPIMTSSRNTSGKKSAKLSSPSTSSFQQECAPISSEPLARRPRKNDSGEFEIKIEPIDIEFNNDSMDEIDDNFMEKTYDEPETVCREETSGQGDDPGGTNETGNLISGNSQINVHEQDQMDFGNGSSDQNFKYEDSASQDGASIVPDLPDDLSQPSSSGVQHSNTDILEQI